MARRVAAHVAVVDLAGVVAAAQVAVVAAPVLVAAAQVPVVAVRAVPVVARVVDADPAVKVAHRVAVAAGVMAVVVRLRSASRAIWWRT